mgnify:CR=1 FL=1
MVVSVLPYSIYTACKYRHSTYQHRLVVGFVFLKALTLLFITRSNVGLNWQIIKTLSRTDVRGHRCATPNKTTQHVSNRQSAYQHKPCKGLTPTVGATD